MNTPSETPSILNYESAKAWPFVEAYKVLAHVEKKNKPQDEPVVFETGYGPSGLPHIGTFGEVFRTTMVKQAFEKLSNRPTQLVAFSDDMDGFRKVPTNLPKQDMLAEALNLPLTQVPDPFGTHKSFGEHNNAMLCKFLDDFEFEYDFMSSTEVYKSGRFNAALHRMLQIHEEICNIVRPTLGEERRKTYSPFLPVCAETGHVLQVPVVETNVENDTIVYEREDGKRLETSILNGACKVQWKADWALRWYALDVDYEMSGKDLIDSVTISSKICRALGKADGRIPPQSYTYEHFVDENGAKISKSKGNGLTIDDWLKYGTPDSLKLYMYHRPERTKKLFLGQIPKTMEELNDWLVKFPNQTAEEQLENPAWHLYNAQPPAPLPVSFNMLLNLLGTVAEDATPELLWGFVQTYRPDVTPTSNPELTAVLQNACTYYTNHILPTKSYHTPNETEKLALADIISILEKLTGDEKPEDIQTEFYTLGKEHYGKERLREWFQLIYTTLFGTQQGPRLGSFVKIYGAEQTIALVKKVTA